MERVPLGSSEHRSSRLVYGCMRLSDCDRPRAMNAISAALASGYNHFDHADIYGGGRCEALFGEFLGRNPGVRDQLIITTKCGIRLPGEESAGSPQHYDFSYQHIMAAVEQSLRHLQTDRIDMLLLHRPDFLMQAGEVAAVFDDLRTAGKVRSFGVSNFNPSQIRMLRALLDVPLQVNQVEINLQNTSALADGTLDICQELNMTPQAWSPLAGVVSANSNNPDPRSQDRIQPVIQQQADYYECEPWIVALAWLLRHPASILPVLGSTNPVRIAYATQALALDYERVHWYQLLEASAGRPVP